MTANKSTKCPQPRFLPTSRRLALSALIDPAVAGREHASVHEDSSIHKPNSLKAETMMKHMILWSYALPGYVRFWHST